MVWRTWWWREQVRLDAQCIGLWDSSWSCDRNPDRPAATTSTTVLFRPWGRSGSTQESSHLPHTAPRSSGCNWWKEGKQKSSLRTDSASKQQAKLPLEETGRGLFRETMNAEVHKRALCILNFTNGRNSDTGIMTFSVTLKVDIESERWNRCE